MKNIFRKFTNFPFHPVFVSIYVVISIFALNIDQIKADAIYRSLLIIPLITMLAWAVLNIILKNWRRSAVLITIYLILFFSYGHLYHYLEVHPVLGGQLGRHRFLLIFFLAVAGVSTWLVMTKVKEINTTTRLFNLLTATLLLFPIFQIVIFNTQQRDYRLSQAYSDHPSGNTQLSTPSSPPDVYYIILDGYLRPDKLETDFGFNDSAFIDELNRLGFYVATCSQANYTQTALSMTSSLNMDYLDSLEQVDLTSDSASVLYPVLANNEVLKLFKQLGYAIISFDPGYFWLDMEDADITYRAESKAINPGESLLKVNGFESMLIRQSAGMLFTDLLTILPDKLEPDLNYPDRYHRDSILYDFDQLSNLPLEVKSPKFIYAHIVAPHPPLVFGANGEWVNLPDDLDPEGWRRAYTNEVQYVNQRTLQVLREIISVSAIPPVIIIQADHGAMISDQQNYPQILNAYYLPGNGESSLYPSISPVNTFRIIFNRYFGGNYPILEDKTYRSIYNAPFEFSQEPDICP
jgi:hypothetical protein